MESLKRLFSPEFRNRLDEIIEFNSLDIAISSELNSIISSRRFLNSGENNRFNDSIASDWLDCSLKPIFLFDSN